MKDFDISKVGLYLQPFRIGKLSEMKLTRGEFITSKQPKPKPYRPKWTNKSPFGKFFEEKVRKYWANKKNSKKN